MIRLAVIAALSLATAACATNSLEPVASPSVVADDPIEAQVEDLLSRMSLKHKVAQLLQPQINTLTVEDMREYRFGSYLNGGNGGPYGDEFAPASEWLRLADEMWEASTEPLPDGEPAIPTMWGTDAVHGHTNVVGATIFPHNIGLGATRDADLVRRIGEATAIEIAVTGIDWNFSPTVAVARDDRWGRTYESYSEEPELVAQLGAALVEGLQGQKADPDRLMGGHVIATAKHFFGDGGTDNGVDQGDVNGDFAALKAIHAVPYPAVIDAGVEAIMASFNSINGTKMHGNRALLTDYLRGELGFDGLVVGDWNGHGQIEGCEIDDCPQALLAGLDIYMVPDDAKKLHASLMEQVQDGTIPLTALDEAVARVLRMKLRAGLIGATAMKPSDRPFAGRYELLGSAAHRAIAREAVAKSQVILKNNGVLPLKPGANVLVAGTAADSVGQASGGWTLEWQGSRDYGSDRLPGATSIWQGIEAAVTARGGRAVLAADGLYSSRPDIAIVVFGEAPYAEFAGDLKDLVLRDEQGLALLRKFKADGVPTVAVFLSGRPMWMNRELNASDAFVAAWLPGSEGAGVADVLTGARAATGRLSFSWPAQCIGNPVNGQEGALFAFGYGRSIDDTSAMPALSEECSLLDTIETTDWFVSGRLGAGVTVSALSFANGEEKIDALERFRGSTLGVSVRGIDRHAQEDAREITLSPRTGIALASPLDQRLGIRIVYKVDERPAAPVQLRFGTQERVRFSIDVTQALSIAAGKGWREMIVTGACAPEGGQGFNFTSEGSFTFQIAAVTREDLPASLPCSF